MPNPIPIRGEHLVVLPLGLPAGLLERVREEAARKRMRDCEFIRVVLTGYFMDQAGARGRASTPPGTVVDLPPLPRPWWKRWTGQA